MNQQHDKAFAAFNAQVEAEMKVEAMLACEHVRDRDEGVPLARGMPSAAALGLGASLPQMVSPNPTVPLPTSQAAFQGALFAVVPLIVPGLLEVLDAGRDGGAAFKIFTERIAATMLCGLAGGVIWSTIHDLLLQYREEIYAALCNGDKLTTFVKWLVVSILSCDQPPYAETPS
jgi:hypothetical protein